MDAKQRLELIRARFHSPVAASTKPAGIFAAANPEMRTKAKKIGPIPFAATGCKGRIQVCEASVGYRAGLQWVREQNPKPVVSLRPKRGYKPHALTRISQQLPMKLTKLPPVEAHFIEIR